MEIKTYDRTDLRPSSQKRFEVEFIADVAGDNPDIFDGDNYRVVKKLKELGAVGKNDVFDEEPSCLYAYFKTKEDGIAFLKKLSAYIRQKKTIVEKAKAF